MIVILPDTAPLIHLAAGGLLDLLPAMGKVVVPDVIALEATRFLTKAYAPEIDAWLKSGVAEIAETEWGANLPAGSRTGHENAARYWGIGDHPVAT